MIFIDEVIDEKRTLSVRFIHSVLLVLARLPAAFQEALAKHGLIESVSRLGNSYENTATESFLRL